jgi:hypothetical protein
MIPGMGSTMANGGGSGAAPGVEGAINSVPPPSPSADGGGGGVVAVDPPPVTVGGQGEKGAAGADGGSGGSRASVQRGQGSVDSAPDVGFVGGESTIGSVTGAPDPGEAAGVSGAGSGEGGVEVEGAHAQDVAGSGGVSVGEPAVVEPVDASGVDAVAPQVASGSTAAAGGAGFTSGAPIEVPGVVKESPLGGGSPVGEEASRGKGRSDDRSLSEKISGIHNTAAQVHQHLPEDSATVSAPTLNIQHGE